jgi:hypothetical protein
MTSETSSLPAISLENWAKSLPASSMVFPDSFSDRLKYFFWRLYTPFHPLLRDGLLLVGIGSQSDAYPEGRQPYVLGTLVPGMTVQEFTDHMIEKGFGNHFIAWKDRGQVVSLRYMEDFKYQYHLRVFEDGEVRGHYEYTPECHPVLHMKMEGVPFEERRERFMEFLGDYIVIAE